jgi:hypothetical protein
MTVAANASTHTQGCKHLQQHKVHPHSGLHNTARKRHSWHHNRPPLRCRNTRAVQLHRANDPATTNLQRHTCHCPAGLDVCTASCQCCMSCTHLSQNEQALVDCPCLLDRVPCPCVSCAVEPLRASQVHKHQLSLPASTHRVGKGCRFVSPFFLTLRQ